MFPQEIFYRLSLQLPPYTLAINHNLYLLYQDVWFEDYLQLKCPKVKLTKQTSYLNLYKKYCQSGKILKYSYGDRHADCIGEGISAADNNINDMILSFNGDLYINDTLVDTGVVAISSFTYIKKYEWYCYGLNNDYDRKWKKINITPQSPFLSVAYCNSYFYAVTEAGLYCWYFITQESRYLAHWGIKEITVDYQINILDYQNKVYSIEKSHLPEQFPQYPVAYGNHLYDRILAINDDTYRLLNSNGQIEDMTISDNPSSKILGAAYYYFQLLVLFDDNKVYRLNYFGKPNKYSVVIPPLFTGVRQMIYHGSDIFFICI